MSLKIKKQCIVLLSGGLDSATVLNIALENYDAVSYTHLRAHET